MHRKLLSLASILIGSTSLFWYIALWQQWITNVTAFNDLVISGLIVAGYIASGSILRGAFERPKLQVEIGLPPSETKELRKVDFLSQTSNASTVFKAELPRSVVIGGLIPFKVTLTGSFSRMFVQGEVKLRDGKWYSFPNSKTINGSGWFSTGNLDGLYTGKLLEWKDSIPETILPGEYVFRIRGYERPSYGRWVWLKLHGLLFLKKNGIIRSIDTRVLDYHEWKPVHESPEHVVAISS